MPRQSVLKSAALLAACGSSCAAERSLLQVTPCGEFLPGLDIIGPILSSVAGSTDNQDCVDSCLAFEGCNAAIRIDATGGCFFKNVDVDTVGTETFPIGTAFLVCADGGGGTPGGGTPTSDNPDCDQFLAGEDIPGANIGSTGGTADDQACRDACDAFDGCNAAVRIDANGACFFKTVDLDTVVPVAAGGITSSLLCGGAIGDGGTPPGDGGTPPGDGGTPPGDGGTPPGDGGTPTSDNPDCDQLLTGQDVPGANIGSTGGTADDQACRDACDAFDGCNAAVRIDANGACFFKTVDLDTIEPVAAGGITSSLLCGGALGDGGTPPGDGGTPPGDGGTPTSDNPDCDQFLAGEDIPGANIGSTGGTADDQACRDACDAFDGCNAAVRIDANGACFFKTVDLDTVVPVAAGGITSSLLCGGPVTDGPGDGGPGAGLPEFCDQFLPSTDIPGENLGAVGGTANNVACLAACQGTDGCNAAIRVNGNGACFFKSVDINAVTPSPAAGLTAYVDCGGDGPGGGPGGGTGSIAAQGSFSPKIDFPLVPVASAALPNGNVLVWSGDAVDTFAPPDKQTGTTFFAVFDSENDSVGPLQTVSLNHDMFCPGIAIQPNGDVVVVGGSAFGDGAASTSIWNGAWSQGPQLNIARGYNTAVTMTSGDVYTLGGSFSGIQSVDKGGEVFNGANWRETTDVDAADILSDDPQGVFRVDNYPFLFPWTGNSLFHAGPASGMNWLTGLGGAGVVTPAGTRGPTMMNGNAVMFEEGKILTVGGAPSYSLGDSARSGAEIITLGAVNTNPNVDAIPGPAVSRTYATVVVLPTGEVAHFGGAQEAVEFSEVTVVLSTEIYSPTTNSWRTDATLGIPRTYHSSAVLVPDGRVFIAGGGLCGGCSINHLDAEMYSPNYLFNADGSPATRPEITASPTTVAPGGSITVTGTETLSMVSMTRFGSSTHSINTDQRRLELCGPSSTPCGGASPTLNIPGQGIAISGPWMVWGINEAGVVSEAAIITVS